ncbi:excinuclease ABC subunit UvrA [Actinopolymorpha sp. B17G11]|uniref:excinuclease ABC subunit UvrA n=1 Tax=Actinopolymorpha sp. B17G11 TaxID=3160861 RepID=UPI0032E4EE47
MEASPRTEISIRGAREHNLKNITVDIPRDQLVVLTGLSGSGKSSLAFDTLYAEGQRRYMESLSTFAKRFIAQVRKPEVDFVLGLSPVISIEQRTSTANPRSTVGTMTDVSNYLNLLYATAADAHCPRCGRGVPVLSPGRVVERVLALPAGTPVDVRAPVYPVYGEDQRFVLTELRRKGYRHLVADGRELDLAEDLELPDQEFAALEVVCDRLSVHRGAERQLLTAVRDALVTGENFVRIVPTAPAALELGCPEHGFVASDLAHQLFMFNNPAVACRTCSGLGTYLQVHRDLLIPDPGRSIRKGCFSTITYDAETWFSRMLYSLAMRYSFDLDTPFADLPGPAQDVLLHGTRGVRIPLLRPPEALRRDRGFDRDGLEMAFDGVQGHIERSYRAYRQRSDTRREMDEWLRRVMVEMTCPDCRGARLRPSRQLFKIGGRTLHELGGLNFVELLQALRSLPPPRRGGSAAGHVLDEITGRLELLVGIGLDYLDFNRRSSTLSGGESQRIRLSTQIGSGLMGMLYVLDEPTIGLHPRDAGRMVAMLRRLRDLGNTVVVVEHDEDMIRAADHLVELGPGAGVHGGEVVAQGNLADLLACERSPTGQFLSGGRSIPMPSMRRRPDGRRLVVRGARENNLRGIDVEFPLGLLVCVTGVSGSGKSTLVNDILYQRLRNLMIDPRQLYGLHDRIDGLEHLSGVVDIDQSPIGRTPRSNPATYLGFYTAIRELFAATPEARNREYGPGHFSFNVKGGRCPDCAGTGTVLTQLHFMPDTETPCEACRGTRFNAETLEVTHEGKSIAEVLDLSVEEALDFFAGHRPIVRKLALLDQLGLGYLTLGQSATTLSGGEAQRLKLALELSKLQRGRHTVYILDEPTTGLHLADIARLLDCLNRLVDTGHTVLVIEHHMDVVKHADHVIDLGPDGGHLGGRVVAAGTPEEIAAHPASFTGRWLRSHLDSSDSPTDV